MKSSARYILTGNENNAKCRAERRHEMQAHVVNRRESRARDISASRRYRLAITGRLS